MSYFPKKLGWVDFQKKNKKFKIIFWTKIGPWNSAYSAVQVRKFSGSFEVEKRCLARRQIVEEAVALVEEQKSPSDGDMWLVRSSKIVVLHSSITVTLLCLIKTFALYALETHCK